MISEGALQKCRLKGGPNKNDGLSCILEMKCNGEIITKQLRRTEFLLSRMLTVNEADALIKTDEKDNLLNLHVLNLMARSLKDSRIREG